MAEKKRWTEQEAIEVINECALIKELVSALEDKAADDLQYHKDKPRLELVKGG